MLILSGRILTGSATLWLFVSLLGGCADSALRDADGPPLGEGRPATRDAVPRVEPRSRYGNPASYVVNGRRYRTLASSRGYVERGVASWYGRKFHGQRTSSGESYDMFSMSAAHRHLPLPTYVRVTHLETGRSVVVRVNDRGPFHPNRVIDLSYAAAKRLGILGSGTAPVEVQAIDPRRPPPATAAVPQPMAVFLQLGAFGDLGNARRLARRLEALPELDPGGVEVRPAAVDGRTLYRVRVGPLPNVAEADRLTLRLPAYGVAPPLLVVEPAGAWGE